MIDVVSTSFYIKSPDFPEDDFKRYSSELFDKWELHVGNTLALDDYSLTLIIEEGSIKGKGAITTTLALLYAGISGYGDFFSSLKLIESQVAQVSSALFDDAKSAFNCREATGYSKRTADAPSYLRHLFSQVQRGKLTPDQAIKQVKARFGDEAEATPGFIEKLQADLSKVPQDPQQLTLIDEAWFDCVEVENKPKDRKQKPPRPIPGPISEHYRVEISRESKSDKKKIKVTKIK